MVGLLVIIKQTIGPNMMYIQGLSNIGLSLAALLAGITISLAGSIALLPPIWATVRTATTLPGWIAISRLSNGLTFTRTKVPDESGGMRWISRDWLAASSAVNNGAGIARIIGTFGRAKAAHSCLPITDNGKFLAAILTVTDFIWNGAGRARKRTIITIARYLRGVDAKYLATSETGARFADDVTLIRTGAGTKPELAFVE